MPHHRVVLRQQIFGYTYEELNLLVAPMARTGAERSGSMGTDTPVAVLSQRPRMLYDYFQQLFAQVTNPPLDAIREEVVTSLQGTVGPEGDLLNPNAESCRQIVLPQPILRNAELSKLICVDPDHEIRGHKHGHARRGDPLPVPGEPRRRRASRRRSTTSGPRCRRPSATARASSCCPTASPTSRWRRSRRC